MKGRFSFPIRPRRDLGRYRKLQIGFEELDLALISVRSAGRYRVGSIDLDFVVVLAAEGPGGDEGQ